ncbi:MAG TPA: tetratricopeptide repeat protein [Polyangiaceae bacterium]|nr:tetratricopeptide repeat protein [Polyangiaceae bacterium]
MHSRPQLERRVRIFVSSTFRDMIEERDELMAQTWPELRRFCRERYVELVEVDLRWGIAEEQSTRKETLKLCLDEVRACRPFFIGLLGERYGWVPGPDAFTDDLLEEQAWLEALRDKSVTELEIRHGVLNNPEMAGRAFFYFRDPTGARARASDPGADDSTAAQKQDALKLQIRKTCNGKAIQLREGYSDVRQLAAWVLEDLKTAIDTEFPKEDVPDPLTREARDHEALAEARRRTYVGRADYFEVLDRNARGDGGPLVLFGESGCGKSALLSNWVEHWRRTNARDAVFQHYIGGTPDSADRWHLMSRLVAEIKRWTEDPEELPRSHDDLSKAFGMWLAKARLKAEHERARFIVVLDALNQLEDKERARLLGWLPAHPFFGPLRLFVSSIPGDTLRVVQERGWETLEVQPLTPEERHRMIGDYLRRFGKKLDAPRLQRLTNAPAAANPLYLKFLLDELRVTGTHDGLDERLDDYLSARDPPALLRKVLLRYQRDYERDRPGLVSEVLGLIWAARRGLTEAEILRLLRPPTLPQLPLASWSPLRAALEEALVDRSGVLNFAHEFLRRAVEGLFVPDQDTTDDFRLRLADEFEAQPVTARSCDELPWLLWHAEALARLRGSLLDIDRFLQIYQRDQDELRQYWISLGEERTLGAEYLQSFGGWSAALGSRDATRVERAAYNLGHFHFAMACLEQAEIFQKRYIALARDNRDKDPLSPLKLAAGFNALSAIYQEQGNYGLVESLLEDSLAIQKEALGEGHAEVSTTRYNLAVHCTEMGKYSKAESLFGQAISALEKAKGIAHPDVATSLNGLGLLHKALGRYDAAEPSYLTALEIREAALGKSHPRVAESLNNLALLYRAKGQPAKGEPLARRALAIVEQELGPAHPHVAQNLNTLALLNHDQGKLENAEALHERALEIRQHGLEKNPLRVAETLNNLALIQSDKGQHAKAVALHQRALAMKEVLLGKEHPALAVSLHNLGRCYGDLHQYDEAEPLVRRQLEILLRMTAANGRPHPQLQDTINDYADVLEGMGLSRDQIQAQVNEKLKSFGLSVGRKEH